MAFSTACPTLVVTTPLFLQTIMIRQVLTLLSLLAGLLAPWMAGVAAAEEMNASDAFAIRTTVQSQLDAFAEDDAVKAFALATDSTRNLLGNAERFLQLIKDQYPPVYRNRLALFSNPEMIDGHALVMVRLTDPKNTVWIAIYEMQQDVEGSWKIDGCNLFETTSVSI